MAIAPAVRFSRLAQVALPSADGATLSTASVRSGPRHRPGRPSGGLRRPWLRRVDALSARRRLAVTRGRRRPPLRGSILDAAHALHGPLAVDVDVEAHAGVRVVALLAGSYPRFVGSVAQRAVFRQGHRGQAFGLEQSSPGPPAWLTVVENHTSRVRRRRPSDRALDEDRFCRTEHERVGEHRFVSSDWDLPRSGASQREHRRPVGALLDLDVRPVRVCDQASTASPLCRRRPR